jgi:hypothetical protein
MSTALRTETNGQSGAVSFNNIDNVKLTNAGPELLGVPLAPTAAANTNTTQLATTAFVTAAVAAAASGVQPSNVPPLADGVAAIIGTALAYARSDHVHPQFTKAGTSVPPALTASGSVGSSTDFARADHTHPAGAQSLGSTGYATMPGGLILQWGFGTFSSSGSAIQFLINFPSAVYIVMATPASASGSETCAVSGQNTSGFTGRSTNNVGCFWMALGK